MERDAPEPLYHRIFLALREQVLNGTFPPGATLPSEQEIGASFGVSRITAKRALDEMAARGMVRRERGRGTRVLRRPNTAPLLASVEGLLENNLAMGLQTDVTVLEFDYLPADEFVAQALHVTRGALVQVAVRVRSLDDQPFSYITTWVPEEIGRGYGRDDLSTMPLLLLLERMGHGVSRATQVIGADNADRAVAKALHVEPRTALLRIERVVYGDDDRPLEFIRSFYVPQRYQYRMDLKRIQVGTSPVWRSTE